MSAQGGPMPTFGMPGSSCGGFPSLSVAGARRPSAELMHGEAALNWKFPPAAFTNSGFAAMLPPPSVPMESFQPAPLPPQPSMSQKPNAGVLVLSVL